MGLLSNESGILLDVVQTDAGRERLARGDGSFKIVKFAVFDDEINYGLYNKDHVSGSAYYDLEILQTPVFEAFTNNASVANSKLLTIPRDNLLYLPVLKLNEVFEASAKRHTDGAFIVAVDEETETSLSIVNGATVNGIMFGESLQGGAYIRVDQGLDSTEISPAFNLDPDLVETQFSIRIDNRFGKITSKSTGKVANVSYIDDDNIATYLLNLGTDPEYVRTNGDKTVSNKQTISGPRGTYIEFQIQSSLDLNTNRSLFTRLGSSKSMSAGNGTTTVDYIDTIVRVEGETTGFRVDIPVRFVKKQ